MNYPNHHNNDAKMNANEPALVAFPFSASHNVAYFQQDHHINLGVAYLVAKSQFGSSKVLVVNNLLKQDVLFQLSLAAFVLLGSITRGQQYQFAKIMCQY